MPGGISRRAFSRDFPTAGTSSHTRYSSFGVEGTVPAIAIQAVVLVALVAVGIKLGGKPTDIWAGEET